MSSKPRSVPGFHSAPGRMLRELASMGNLDFSGSAPRSAPVRSLRCRLTLGVLAPTVVTRSGRQRMIAKRFLPGAEPLMRAPVGREALAGAVGEEAERPALGEV